MKNNKLIIVFVLTTVFFSLVMCACADNEIESKEEKVTQTIDGYLSSLKSHDIEKVDSFLSEDLKLKNNYSDEIIKNHYYTIEDCYLISIDFDKFENTHSNIIVLVEYIITYSEDYIPVGNIKNGENHLKREFTLTEDDGKYIITDISYEYLVSAN